MDREVLPQTRQVDELEVYELYPQVFRLREHGLRRGLRLRDFWPGGDGHRELALLSIHYAFVRRRAGTTDDASLRSFRDSRRAIFLVGTRGLPRVQCPSSWANLC